MMVDTPAEFREQAQKLFAMTAQEMRLKFGEMSSSEFRLAHAILAWSRAAIRALPIPEPWRPIETAPKNGTWFFAGFPEMQPHEDYCAYSILRFCDGDWQDEEGTRGYDNFVWMPFDALPALPAPPAKEPTK